MFFPTEIAGDASPMLSCPLQFAIVFFLNKHADQRFALLNVQVNRAHAFRGTISLAPSLVSYRMADKCVVKEQGKDVVGTMCGSNKDRQACKRCTSLQATHFTCNVTENATRPLSLLFTVHAVQRSAQGKRDCNL